MSTERPTTTLRFTLKIVLNGERKSLDYAAAVRDSIAMSGIIAQEDIATVAAYEVIPR